MAGRLIKSSYCLIRCTPALTVMSMGSRAALFLASFSLFCIQGACSDKATRDGDGDVDLSVPCADLGEAECEGRSSDKVPEEHACHIIMGRDSCEAAADDSITWEFILCEEGGDGDGAAVTCATDPETGEPYTFPSTGVPSGWTGITCSEAAQACEMGGAGGGN